MDVNTYTFYAPCSLLDIEAMQTWLEDMSMEGYLLKSCSKARHKFEFYKIEPLRTRYRLTPVSDEIEEWNLRPNEEFVSITESFGWEYVCSTVRIHIFRSYDEEAREIHTDPSVQAQAIRQLGQRIVKTALIWMSLPLIYILILLAFGAGHFWQTLILDGTGIQIIMAYFVLIAMARATVELVHLCKLYRQVKQGYAPVSRKEWKKKAPAYRAAFRAYPVILFILALLVVLGRAAYRDSAAYKDLPAPGTELPFLSVADMAQQSDIQSAERIEDVGYIRNWAHLLSPVNYDWAEIVEITDNNGIEGLVSIQVYYHEARFDWVAENLSQEYLAQAKQSGTEMADQPQTSADLAYFYFNEYGKPAAVLKYGNIVICIEFPRSDIDMPELKFEYWIETLDNALAHK